MSSVQRQELVVSVWPLKVRHEFVLVGVGDCCNEAEYLMGVQEEVLEQEVAVGYAVLPVRLG